MIDDEIQFEWDAKKATSNLEKHGVSFEEAKLVFDDQGRDERLDNKNRSNEPRLIVVGMVNGRHLTVVYTDRSYDDMENLRLISARESLSADIARYRAGFTPKRAPTNR
jgi:uncharacterized DUF497 family protein